MPAVAGVAQLVEQWFCKPQVGGSTPSVGTTHVSSAEDCGEAPQGVRALGGLYLGVTPKGRRYWRFKTGFSKEGRSVSLLVCTPRSPELELRLLTRNTHGLHVSRLMWFAPSHAHRQCKSDPMPRHDAVAIEVS